MKTKPLIIALDTSTIDKTNEILSVCDPKKCRVKIGKELFVSHGPDWVRSIIDKGYDVFLDLKFHDIPNTVKMACKAAADLGVWMVNVHTLGGVRMMKAAKEGIMASNHHPLLIGVTILTSMTEADLSPMGFNGPISEHVNRLSALAKNSDLDGVVCSAIEAKDIKSTCGSAFITVCPGIQFGAPLNNDQRRVMSPREAINHGADYLVVGRSITQSEHPQAVIEQILESLA